MSAINNCYISDYGYGKNNVKLLYVNKENPRHEAAEYEVNISLKLDNVNDHIIGCNKSVIATDSLKNTVYIMAKKYGVKSPEEFGLRLCQHFLATYTQVILVNITVGKMPWNRINLNGSEHNHAFMTTCVNSVDNNEIRMAKITQQRDGPPIVSGGIEGLGLMKTTQSGFTGFVDDEFRSLPDSKDRVFRTIVSAKWEYLEDHSSIDFDAIYDQIRRIIIEVFAGHPHFGVYSPSVQRTLYRTCEKLLNDVLQVKEVSMKLPNVHYLDFDFTKFSNVVTENDLKNSNQVYVPVDKPNGVIGATSTRKQSEP